RRGWGASHVRRCRCRKDPWVERDEVAKMGMESVMKLNRKERGERKEYIRMTAEERNRHTAIENAEEG
ncbi:MAG TPA: hypothetical protein PLZ24_16605, partial [Flavobacteriales bacterium]|nr:hypothetical protein [Flavobacteriales bacterium]